MTTRLAASVRYASSDDAFEVIVDLEPSDSLVEAIQDTGEVQLEEWHLVDVWIPAVTCPLCNGGGVIAYGPWGSRPPKKTCPACDGDREVPYDAVPGITKEYRL